MRPTLLLLAAGLVACDARPAAVPRASAPAPVPDAAAPALPPDARTFTLVYTAELFGTVEPCGCTSDPLGDLARFAALLGRLPNPLWVDGGAMLHPAEPGDDRKAYQRTLRARMIADLARERGLVLSRGGGPELPHADRVVDAGGIKVGIVTGGGEPALAAAVERSRQAGAEVVVALLGQRREARRLLGRVPGIDVGVVGDRVGEGDPIAERVGDAILVQPADQGRRAGVLRLVLRSAPHQAGRLRFVDAVGAGSARARLRRLGREAAALRERLPAWEQQADADRAFVAGKKEELARLEEEMRTLEARPLQPPSEGGWFENDLVEIKRALPRDEAVARRMRDIDREVSRRNFELARREPPLPVPAGAPTYVGSARCGEAGCHPQALALWKTTAHGHAWKTLVDVDKQYDYDCIGCHVTGYGRPGGASLGHHDRLVDVGCESCHGPASKHVAEEGLEDRPTVVKKPPPDLCARECHTPEHSDTFQLEAYLRDILGPGHGAKRRQALGPGPTGRELRAAASAKAKSH